MSRRFIHLTGKRQPLAVISNTAMKTFRIIFSNVYQPLSSKIIFAKTVLVSMANDFQIPLSSNQFCENIKQTFWFKLETKKIRNFLSSFISQFYYCSFSIRNTKFILVVRPSASTITANQQCNDCFLSLYQETSQAFKCFPNFGGNWCKTDEKSFIIIFLTNW